MKKSMAILVLLIFTVSGLFAQGFSMRAGGGGLFDWSFNNGVETKIGDDKYYDGTRNLALGGFIFFDAAYVEIDASFAYGILTQVTKIPGDDTYADKAGNLLQGSVGLLLKYPLDFGSRVTFFPLIGVNYNMVFAAKDENGDKYYESASDTIEFLSQFGLLGGAGVDVFLKGSLFMRIELLYHLRFASKFMKDSADADPDSYTTLGMGPRVKIGVGYKFR